MPHAALLALAPLLLPADGEVVSSVKLSDPGGAFLGTLSLFGTGVTSLGDLDGDGVEDLAVGAPRDSQTAQACGAVFLLFMTESGVPHTIERLDGVMSGYCQFPSDGALFGSGLASLGDRTGDGSLELAVGVLADSNGRDPYVSILSLDSAGSVLNDLRIGDGLAGLTVNVPSFAEFGQAIADLGDLDGDGANDLVVGSVQKAVLVARLHPDGTVKNNWEVGDGTGSGPPDATTAFGRGVARLRDLDGDGITDLAVGDGSAGGDFEGGVWILYLNANGTAKSFTFIGQGSGGFTGDLDKFDDFGAAVTVVGDLDGNGIEDLAVGAPEDDDGGTDRGAVWILFLGADGNVIAHEKISSLSGGPGVPALDDGDRFGESLARLETSAGVARLAVGAPQDDDGAANAGAVYLLELDGFASPPAATVANGTHQNALRLSSTSLPRIDTTWTLEMDSSAHPGVLLSAATFWTAPLEPGVVAPTGELLVDLTSLFLGNLIVPASGGPDVLTAAVPNDPGLVGLEIFGQGVLLGGGDELANALHVTIGN